MKPTILDIFFSAILIILGLVFGFFGSNEVAFVGGIMFFLGITELIKVLVKKK